MFKKLIFTFLGFVLLSCAEDAQPKPSGELRLEYPVAKYQQFYSPCNFGFEYSNYEKVEQAKNACWYYIDYPKNESQSFHHLFSDQK